MSDVFYTSDLHFGHVYMAKLRGFSSVEAHDNHIVESWNRAVTKRDHVWILGDLALGGPKDWWEPVIRLNGTKHLVFGNHDEGWAGNRGAYSKRFHYTCAGGTFASVQDFAVRKIGGVHVMLSHFPYEGDHSERDRYLGFRLRDCEAPILHGHTHSAGVVSLTAKRTLQVHVGWDAWHRPVSTNEIHHILVSEDPKNGGL